MTEEKDEKTATEGKPKKGEASFRIPSKSVDVLIANKATAFQIGTYLTLALHTDAGGKFASAGFNAIRNALSVSGGTKGKAAQLIKHLLHMGRSEAEIKYLATKDKPKKGKPKAPPTPSGLLYMPEEWRILTGEEIPTAPVERGEVRYVLNDFGGEEWVCFSAKLVRGHGRFQQPLRRLKQCGNVAARLLLMMYKANDMEEFGGVSPSARSTTVYKSYDTEYLQTSHGYAFWKATGGTTGARCNPSVVGLEHFSTKQKQEEQEWRLFWDALASLNSSGFIYEMVTVMDGAPDHEDSRPIYELHARTSHGHPPKGEEGHAARIDAIFQAKNQASIADKKGRFRGEYPVLSRAGIKPHVAGIYRLRFRLSNPKNYTVSEAWQRIHRDRKEAVSWMERLEKHAGVESPKAQA